VTHVERSDGAEHFSKSFSRFSPSSVTSPGTGMIEDRHSCETRDRIAKSELAVNYDVHVLVLEGKGTIEHYWI